MSSRIEGVDCDSDESFDTKSTKVGMYDTYDMASDQYW
jgi:hypothetical protein